MTEPDPRADSPSCTLDLAGVDGPLLWPDVFGNDRPVELEVGSGKGLFLQNAAASCPGRNFVGVELSRKYAAKAAARVEKHGLANARVWRGDAKVFLARFVASSSLDAVHVYFPDPWWKARHKKRRVFGEPLLADVERSLRPGGRLCVATDVEEYFDVIRGLVGGHPRFEPSPLAEPGVPDSGHEFVTNFERKYRVEGRPIYRAAYVLRD